jgi:hypothetical protein
MYSGVCGLNAKSGTYDGSGNLRMLFNMVGYDDGVTQFNSSGFNVF